MTWVWTSSVHDTTSQPSQCTFVFCVKKKKKLKRALCRHISIICTIFIFLWFDNFVTRTHLNSSVWIKKNSGISGFDIMQKTSAVDTLRTTRRHGLIDRVLTTIIWSQLVATGRSAKQTIGISGSNLRSSGSDWSPIFYRYIFCFPIIVLSRYYYWNVNKLVNFIKIWLQKISVWK